MSALWGSAWDENGFNARFLVFLSRRLFKFFAFVVACNVGFLDSNHCCFVTLLKLPKPKSAVGP